MFNPNTFSLPVLSLSLSSPLILFTLNLFCSVTKFDMHLQLLFLFLLYFVSRFSTYFKDFWTNSFYYEIFSTQGCREELCTRFAYLYLSYVGQRKYRSVTLVTVTLYPRTSKIYKVFEPNEILLKLK